MSTSASTFRSFRDAFVGKVDGQGHWVQGSERSKIGNAYPKSEIEDQQPQPLGRNIGSVQANEGTRFRLKAELDAMKKMGRNRQCLAFAGLSCRRAFYRGPSLLPHQLDLPDVGNL